MSKEKVLLEKSIKRMAKAVRRQAKAKRLVKEAPTVKPEKTEAKSTS